MLYFALMRSQESEHTPEKAAAGLAAFQAFHAKAASALLAGDALAPTAEGVRIEGGPDRPGVLTDGPFPESTEVACGYYVLDADNLDDALALARDIPVAEFGVVEIWPIVHWKAPTEPIGNDWLALLLEPPENVRTPGTDEWNELVGRHVELESILGDQTLTGAPLHPPSTATTVRVRNGEVAITDGPYVEGAEVANGFYVLRAADRDEAIKLASMLPASAVELRQLAGVSGL
ncbi:transcription initiation protein [Mycolicibacterium goodii]|uniref:YciI family protein n=1 Tax=Mycolicibacterium goodii TaxID=134601 RepID=UPI001BDD6004|nr:YciI family protein [Mycolicibacterium goodii]MBU8809501.1 transcription initiation protein [Mycolicibacterium goodii]MBU8815727.1 transcription initiation protein [Mycolicibacterium goodii]